MSKTVLFTFGNEAERANFIDYLESLSQKPNAKVAMSLILKGIIYDPHIVDENQRTVGLFVSGKKMAEGPLSEITKKFNHEIMAHSAIVNIKEKKDNKWVTIRSRK